MTMEVMDPLETPSFLERTYLNRELSRTPPWPTTFALGNPDAFRATYAMASIGLVTIRIIELGACFAMFFVTSAIIPEFFARRSILVIPGFLARPAVTTTRSAPASAEKSAEPLTSTSMPASESL
jgi:hypothetical protein